MSEKIRFQADSFRTSIVYTLDNDEEIDTFSDGMLSNNIIKGIPAHTYEINGTERTLSYSVPKGVPFATLIKQSLKKEVVITILKNIADILVRAEEYMLDCGCLLLEHEYIFVDTATLEPSMIFIPTNKPYGKPFRTFIKSCIVTGIFDLSGDTQYVMQINNFLNTKSNASAKEIWQFLDALSNNKGSNGAQLFTSASVRETVPPVQSMASIPQPAPVPVSAPVPASSPVQAAPRSMNIPENPAKNAAPAETPQRKKGLFGFRDKKEKAPAKSAPSGSFSGMQIPGMNQSVPEPPPKPEKPQKASKKKGAGAAVMSEIPTPGPMSRAPEFQPVQYSPQPAQLEQSDETVPLSAYPGAYGGDGSEATVLLGQNGAAGSMIGFLEHRNGVVTAINKDCFFIGKGTNTGIANDLVIRNDKVSRNHAVIERVGTDYFIKDNNSLNGTFVNGARIAPNIRVALANGDKVVFANEEYVFVIKPV